MPTQKTGRDKPRIFSALGRSLRAVGLSLTLLWAVYLANLLTPYDLRLWGIVPRTWVGLRGILAAPLLHIDLEHLIANSAGLAALLLPALAFSRRLTALALATAWLLGGSLVWLLGAPHSLHVGASGLVFGLIGFLLLAGVFRGEWEAIGISLGVLLAYGGALYSLLDLRTGISWSSHFFGLAAGALVAWATRRLPAR